MQFKSEKSWCKTSLSFLLVGAFALFPVLSFGTLTVTSVSKTPGSVGNTLQNLQNGTYWYPVQYTTSRSVVANPPSALPTFGVIDPLANFIDLGWDPQQNGTVSDPGVILFDVLSTGVTYSQAPVVIAYVNNSANTSPTNFLIPIISSANVVCSTSNSNCIQGTSSGITNFDGDAYFYGGNYTQGENIQIGISPQALCYSASKQTPQGQVAIGCNGQYISSLGTAPEAMTFNFEIINQSDLINAIQGSIPLAVPSVTPLDGPYQVQMNFESLAVPAASASTSPSPSPSPTPDAVCTFSDGVYKPVQSGLQINGSSQYFQITGDTISADPLQIVVIAAPSPTALNFTAQTYTNNAIVSDQLALPQSGTVGGFQNSTPQNVYLYTVGFLLEDAAGFVFDPGNDGNSCVLPGPFDTSNVQGFLQASKCFIATAAFRSMDSAPLVLLRAFRDRFLERFSLGRSFVHWYYQWSPDAADWLIDHPIFRFPVLLALIPLQMLAWIVLHPIMILVLMMSGASLLAWSVLRRREDFAG